MASSFYDLHPLVMAAGPSADLSGLTPRAFAETRSRRQAPKDLRGVYRFLLSMVPTRTVARRIPQLFTQLFDFGKAEISREECSEIDATFDGIPSALAPWFGTVVCAYGESALRTSGAERASFTLRPAMLAGSAHGVPLARFIVEIRWK